MKFIINAKLKRKRQIVRNYIRNNPNCTTKNVSRDTKIKIERVYKNFKEAYKAARVRLPKSLTKRNLKQQRRDVIRFIKKHPGCTVTEIQKNTGVGVPHAFGSILDAYRMARVEYPEKKVTSGVMNPLVVKRYGEFEKKIVGLLEDFGEVRPKIRTSGGIIDCLFFYGGQIFVVEIKDFRGKNNITMFELKQLIRYMKSLNLNKGLLICPKESFPKRKNSRNIYIENLNLRILSEEDLWGCSINHLL